MIKDPIDPELNEDDLAELDILALLQSREAIAAFDTLSAVITPRTAGRFAELLRMINRLAARGDFAAAVDAELLAAVRSPGDITRLERFGALASDDLVFKLAAVQMLRTLHETVDDVGAAPAEGSGDVR